MPQNFVVVSDTQAFDSTITEQVKNSGANPLFVYVLGARDENGVSWCPDCVKSDPIIHGALNKIPNYTLVECPVVRSEYKGNPNFPYRTHPQLQIKSVPTLIQWNKDGPQQRLVDDELFTPEPIAKFINPFL